jgi:hypothetical protein
VVKSRDPHCGEIELAGYLANAAAPVPLVMHLRIVHDRFGSSSDPNLNGHLHYPNDIDRPLNEAAADKIRKYRADYNNKPPLQIQEFSSRNLTVDTSTTAAWCSPQSLNRVRATFSPKLQLYVLRLT